MWRCLGSLVWVVAFCLGKTFLLAQWAPAGIPFKIIDMANIHADTIGDALYFCGESSLNNDFVFDDGAIPVYKNGQWDTLGVFNGRPQTIVRWGDTLLVGGYFSIVAGAPLSILAGFVQGVWIPFGGLPDLGPYRFKTIAGELYVIGTFGDQDNTVCHGIAKRVGGHWEPVGCLTSLSTNVQDLVMWRDTLYITGSIKFGGVDDPKDVAYFDGTDWVALGPGIKGNIGIGRSLAVYHDELYVSGSIPLNAGNAGHGIMRWDGSQFHSVGTGFQGADNGTGFFVGAIEMEVYNDLLWACGSFRFAGNVPAPGIAYWDGYQWCGLPLGPNVQVNSIEFFHDTLFAGCQQTLYGEWVDCGVRFTGGTYSDTCSLALSVEGTQPIPSPQMRAYRRADGLVELTNVPAGKHAVEVFDGTGRVVYAQQVQCNGNSPALLPVPALSFGFGLIRVGTVGAVRFVGP